MLSFASMEATGFLLALGHRIGHRIGHRNGLNASNKTFESNGQDDKEGPGDLILCKQIFYCACMVMSIKERTWGTFAVCTFNSCEIISLKVILMQPQYGLLIS